MLLVAIAMVLGAIGWVLWPDAEQEQEPPAPAQQADPPAPAAVEEPEPKHAPDDSPPPPLEGLTSLDPETVVRTYIAYRTWAFEHPQAAVEEKAWEKLWHRDCRCYAQGDLLQRYAERGWWWTGPGEFLVRDVEQIAIPGQVETDPAKTGVLDVRVVYERTATGKLINADGEVLKTAPERRWVEQLMFTRGNPMDPEDAGLGEPWKLLHFIDRGDVEAGEGAGGG